MANEYDDVREVPYGEVLRIFNDCGYLHRILIGDLWPDVIDNGHPSPPMAGEPFCTRSQKIVYRDDAMQQVVTVHQYLRQDGTLGLSGRPDPQELVHDRVLYIPYKPGE
jgi:hypothetical protein